MSEHLISVSRLNQTNPYENQSQVDLAVYSTILHGLGINNLSDLSYLTPKDSKIFIKPNWVFDKPRSSSTTMECLITNRAIIISVLRFLNELKPSKIIIGDSPIQKCDFKNILTPYYEDELRSQISTDINFIDFRRFIPPKTGDIYSGLIENRNLENYILFNLESNSLLEPVSSKINKFQITNYDNTVLNRHHRKGSHEYLICKEIFDVDIVINLPKLKMHAKAGYTGAVKNFVGCVGDKLYLPHYRMGGTKLGGDCYPGWHILKLLAEWSLNKRNQAIPNVNEVEKWKRRYQKLIVIDQKYSQQKSTSRDQIFEGSWFGNDTVWRMAMDIFTIISQGNLDGTISSSNQRDIWTLTDALICGEGQGPLYPSPRNLGLLTFSESPLALDLFHGFLVGYKLGEVKFLDNLVRLIDADNINVVLEGKRLGFNEALKKFKVDLLRPKHWGSEE